MLLPPLPYPGLHSTEQLSPVFPVHWPVSLFGTDIGAQELGLQVTAGEKLVPEHLRSRSAQLSPSSAGWKFFFHADSKRIKDIQPLDSTDGLDNEPCGKHVISPPPV